MSDQVATPNPADRFQKMAERITHNANESFGGAYVIVPPGGGDEMIEVLILDQHEDAIQFFKMLSSKIQLLMEQLDRKAQLAGGFNMR